MSDNDPGFENFLREFQPRQPRALPDGSVPRLPWRRLAAAAVLVISFGSLAWFPFRKNRIEEAPRSIDLTRHEEEWRKFTLIQWTRLAEEDPRALDAQLNEASRKSLPGFNEANSSLRALAKP
jgi:hypothetical protein